MMDATCRLAVGLLGRVSIVSEVVKAEVDHAEISRIGHARNRDPTAIDWLIARYRSRVIRLATHILRRPDEAEDVAQEAFVKAFRNLHSYRDEGAFYTWLYRIVVRICLDRRNLARWRHEQSMSEQVLDRVEEDPAIGDVEIRIVVDRLMDRLSPGLRAALVLRELEGLEYAEIAEVLGIPVGLVRWRLHTARRQFRALWAEAESEVPNA